MFFDVKINIIRVPQRRVQNNKKGQPDLTAIHTYFMRWLIRTTSSLIQIHKIFAKSYVFYELPIRTNSYDWPTPNPAPKPTRHWGLDKSYKIVRVRSYEFVRISCLVKYVRIAVR